MARMKNFDIVVVGAGSFGAWTAHFLRAAGLSVLLLDQYGPGNARASSGGESRIIRMGYGPDAIYTRMAQRSLDLWRELFARQKANLFYPTGMLWLAAEADDYTAASEHTLREYKIAAEHLSAGEMARRFPQIALENVAWALWEPGAGVLLARRAAQAVVDDAVARGVEYRAAAAQAPLTSFPGAALRCSIASLATSAGERVGAGTFVFCCGPWLPKLFPLLLGQRMFVTRQEILFFGPPAGDARFCPPAMPAWLHHAEQVYGTPDLENRGFKLAFDLHGPAFDPDTSDRTVAPGSAAQARDYLARRFPALREAPLVEARVCQYENSANGDFILDRHPELENVWIAGGGSGHGFKHGPAVGEYMAGLIAGTQTPEPRFSIASQATTQQRAVY
jgi:sarcosine oxidase